MVRICAHRPEEVPEASPLATSGLHRAVLRQHRRALLRRRGRARRVAAALVVRQATGCGFREGDSTLRGCAAHPVVGPSPEQRGEATAVVAPGRRRRRRCRRRRRRLAGQREVRRIICEHADRTVAARKLNTHPAAEDPFALEI